MHRNFLLMAICSVMLSACAEKTLPVKTASGNSANKTGSQSQPEVPTPVKKTTSKTDSESASTKSKTKPKKVSNTKPPAFSPKPNYLPREEFQAGWIKLFDDHTLFGWKANSDANWRVENGTLIADGGTAGLLVTDVPFANYELRCEYRLAKGGNSGIFLRSLFDPKDAARDCYELNMCDSHPTHPTGSLVFRKKADVKSVGEGEWKKYHVTLDGRKIVVKLDGKTVLDFQDDTPNFRPSGYIGLQYREGKIEFRNISLRPLGGKPVFNGNDLTGWTLTPGAKGKVAVENSELRMTGGPAFLQSKETYGDFVLQMDAKTHAARVNSGLFFRAMPGSEQQPANGYELQIHNGFKNGDRTQPDDYQTGYGTGAIFRFAKARWVVPNDNEWCTITLVAHGNRFASWVNGHQVTSWTDNRKPNDNPRRGQRLKAGHLILQAHDDQCDISFRNLNVQQFP
ncbi:MAG: DUF1080 domain-containing protein [Planctomycetaceae bacterium]